MSKPTAPNASDYLSPEEAGAKLNLSPRTLEKLRSDGGGPRFHKLGRRIRYLKSDLTAWAESRACNNTSDAAYQRLRRGGGAK